MKAIMAEGCDKVLENDPKKLSSRDKAMSDTAYAQSLFREAFPLSRYGKAAAAIIEAYRILKPLVEPHIDREFTVRRVRSLHEGSARRVDGAELDALKLAQIEEARREQKELRERLARLDEALALADEDFHGPSRAALRGQMGSLRRMDRTGTERW